MKIPNSIYYSALALGLMFILPTKSSAAVVYNEIVVKNSVGTVLASLTATPTQLTDPDAIFYLPSIAVDPTEFGNYGIVLEDGDPFELFGIADTGPDGLDLAFALQDTAMEETLQNTVIGTGAPIDLTQYLAPSLQAAGDTASFIVSTPAMAVPEPLTWTMMLIGFAGMGYALRRKGRASLADEREARVPGLPVI